jgi:gas vesicle protein
VDEGERPEKGADNGDFLTGFFTGALAGAAIAMILTPQSGDDLRHVLRATIRALSNRARDLAADIGETRNEPGPTPDGTP